MRHDSRHAETVGNVTKTHFDVLIKKADRTEQNIEGMGRAFKPEVASTTSMSFRFTKDDIRHGKYHIKCLYRTCCFCRNHTN
jgi:hypothetical protein